MTIAPQALVLYRRTADILFGWYPLDPSIAKSYNLYSSPTPTGVYTLLQSGIQNNIDRNYKDKVVTTIKDSDIPIPPLVRYYFKLTYVDITSIESNINLSPVTTIFPPNVEHNFENEAREANNHNFAWVEQNQRWEKLLLTPDGKLMVDATVDIGSITIGNVKIATLPDGTTLEYLLVDNNRRVVTSQDPSAYNRFKDFEETLSVAPNVETTVLTYTNAQAYYLDKIICTGTADARFNLKINGVTTSVLRSSWNCRNVMFDFSDKSLYCSAGATITVTATHSEITSQDYDVTLAGYNYSY